MNDCPKPLRTTWRLGIASDERLEAVAEHVRTWLFPADKNAVKKKAKKKTVVKKKAPVKKANQAERV